MSKKGRTLALAVTTAGLIGLLAPMASAATAANPGDSGGLVNLSHNQVPIQACDNKIPVNVLGIQVPVSEVPVALGLLSHGVVSEQNSSCTQVSVQNNGRRHHRPVITPFRAPETFGMEHGTCEPCARGDEMRGDEMGFGSPIPGLFGEAPGPGGGDHGLVNVSHNQIPIQLCNNKIPVNVLGVQVPVDEVTAALGLASVGTAAIQNSTCRQGSLQHNR